MVDSRPTLVSALSTLLSALSLHSLVYKRGKYQVTPALLAQLSFRRGEYAAAAAYAADAFGRFYPLATAWDKRRSLAHWVGFARMLHLRALRLLQGRPSLPAASTTQVSAFGASLHSIPAIVEQLP